MTDSPAGVRTSLRHAALRTITALILREMSTRYGRTPGGYIWAILEPLGVIVMLAIGFSLLIRAPSLGTSFILFYATGYLPFSLYVTVSNMVAKSIQFSRPLLFYPGVTWIDAVIARFLLNALTGVLVMFLLLSGILWFTDTRTVIEMGPVIEATLLVALLALGVGCLNCFLTMYFPVWDTIWSIVTRPLFLASGVFFLYEDMPPAAQAILWYNPLIHTTGIVRTGFYPMYEASYAMALYPAVFGLICLTLGLLLLRRHHKELINA